MFNITKFLTFEYEKEYVFEYDLLVKKKFSTPKIYNANGDLSKRWYVYYSYRNPETGYLEKNNLINRSINSFNSN